MGWFRLSGSLRLVMEETDVRGERQIEKLGLWRGLDGSNTGSVV